MKKWLVCFAVLMPLLFVAGCEPFSSEDEEGHVEFVNKSDYNVTVIPESRSGLPRFSLDPGDKRKFSDVYDVFFSYQPESRVVVGRQENGRVVFVNGGDTVEID